ncbi:hypothetical protein HMPREF1584_01383 [Gardnerella vaginalis JCP8481A]|nr:hypothetical protein HMPREF1584_01383 [Gardnerella vaginalis JCP8481A]
MILQSYFLVYFAIYRFFVIYRFFTFCRLLHDSSFTAQAHIP